MRASKPGRPQSLAPGALSSGLGRIRSLPANLANRRESEGRCSYLLKPGFTRCQQEELRRPEAHLRLLMFAPFEARCGRATSSETGVRTAPYRCCWGNQSLRQALRWKAWNLIFYRPAGLTPGVRTR